MSTPLIFKRLSLANFLSFGQIEAVFELDDQGIVSIVGENRDSTGSNGAGKSTFYQAICYAIYDKPLDMISKERLINSTNAKLHTQMYVRLEFSKGVDEYEIYRARGEEYTIEVKKNGVNITPGKGVIETNKLIKEIIGISYELFTRTVIFSGSHQAFLQLPISQQRDQIEELFNITLLSEKAKNLKDNIRLTESDIKVAEAVVKQQEVTLELHKKHVKEANQRIEKWEANRLQEIATIEATCAKVADIDFEAEQLLHDEKAQLTEQGSYLASKLIPTRKEKTNLTNEVTKLMKEQEHLAEAKCPYCTQQYADAPLKLVILESELEDKGAKLLELEDSLSTLEAEEVTRKERLADVSKHIKHPDLNSLLSARMNSAVLQQKVKELEVAMNPHTEAFTRLVEDGCPEPDTSKVDTLKRRLDHMSFLLKLLTDKNSFVRRRIINKTIPFLNGRLNYYTNLLGLPHVVKFDADMSCTVAEFGRELDFGNLSAGEKRRVNFAMSLAFRDVLQHLHARTNLLMIDEIDGALDQPGIDSIIKVLKDKSRDDGISVYVISHHPTVAGRLDRELRIVKEQGFSSIVSD